MNLHGKFELVSADVRVMKDEFERKTNAFRSVFRMSARQRKRGERPFEDDKNVSGAPVVPAEVPFKSTAWVEQRDAAARSHRSRPNKNLSQILNGENYHLLPCDHPTCA